MAAALLQRKQFAGIMGKGFTGEGAPWPEPAAILHTDVGAGFSAEGDAAVIPLVGVGHLF